MGGRADPHEWKAQPPACAGTHARHELQQINWCQARGGQLRAPGLQHPAGRRSRCPTRDEGPPRDRKARSVQQHQENLWRGEESRHDGGGHRREGRVERRQRCGVGCLERRERCEERGVGRGRGRQVCCFM